MYLKELSELNGGSGDERRVREFLEEKIKPHVDKVWTDKLGNLIAFKKGKSSDFKLALIAHMDEVSFMVTAINEDGTLSFAPVGGIDPRVVIGKVLLVGEDTYGVVGYKPIHLQREKVEKVSYKELKIDIGAKKKKEVKVKVGSYVYFTTKYEERGEFAVGKAFDDRAGCSVALDVAMDSKPSYDTYFIFTVQEEIGPMGGAAVLMEQIDLSAAIILEGTTAGDIPELERYKWATHLGNGPAITFFHSGYAVDERIFKTIIRVAKEANIHYQVKMRTAGGTDARNIAKKAKGAPAGVISVPCRYIHSPVSVLNLNDYKTTVNLVKILVENEDLGKALKCCKEG